MEPIVDVAQADRLSLRATHRHPPSAGSPMITGIVTADREAVIRLVVRGPAGREEVVDAVEALP